MAIRVRNAVFASSGIAALLVACLLSASGGNLAKAQSDWASQLVQDDSEPPQDAAAQAPPGEPDWEAQMASIIQQVANQTFLSSFGQIFTSYFESEQLFIDQDATILIPTNVGYWRYETQWDTLTRKQKRRLLRYHILKGRYTTQQLLDAAPLTLFPTFNQNLPVNKTLKPNEVYFQSVPPTRFVSPLSVPNAGLTDNIAAHGVTMVLQPPNLN
ncbi:unnamed protein product [Closterium sp. Yama58-4]|nr:unnamed protein product [Closterium sp. Yama58-4]